jgi:hypothetical protein
MGEGGGKLRRGRREEGGGRREGGGGRGREEGGGRREDRPWTATQAVDSNTRQFHERNVTVNFVFKPVYFYPQTFSYKYL